MIDNSMDKVDNPIVEITDMAEDGAGIGHTEDGMAIFVSGAVYGDIVKVRITKAKKNYAFSEVIEILKLSPYRVEHKQGFEKSGINADDDKRFDQKSIVTDSVCPYIEACGGCAFGFLNYETQLMLKAKHVQDKIERIAGIESPKINPIIGMDSLKNYWGYRNKASMAVGLDEQGKPAVGFRGRKSHKIVNCDNCMIQAPTANIAANVLREYVTKYPYLVKPALKGRQGNKSRDSLVISGMTVKTAFGTGEVMVIVNVNGKGELPEIEDFCYDLEDAIYSLNKSDMWEFRNENTVDDSGGALLYSLESVVVNREYEIREGGKKAPVKTITKTKLEYIAGKHTIKDRLMGLDFEISPRAFYQVNPVQTEKLYSKVLEYLSLENDSKPMETSANDMILDLYCGVGTIGTLIAKNYEGEVLGIESVKEAVIDANRNAVINGVVNERFICGKAEEVLPAILNKPKASTADEEDETEGIDKEKVILKNISAVILDPPRAGCDEDLLNAVAEVSPQRIIYVSCNPGTLARDVKFLIEKGYELVEASPVDMFCHSSHVEAVILLSLANC